jgi:hypothetical protein
MSWYNNNRNAIIKYKNAMNNLDKYQFAFDQYDYGIPGEDDPEVQNMIAQQMARVKLESMDNFPKVPTTSYKAPMSIQKKSPFTKAQRNYILSEIRNNKLTEDDYNYLLGELDNELSGSIDYDKLGIDYSQFRVPRRRISRKPKSQYAKKKASTKRKTIQKKKKTATKRKTVQKKKY